MDEYISKKQAVDLLETLPNPYNLLSLHTIGMAIDFIKNYPAADVQSVKHGQWICEFYNDVFDVYQADCSACKRESTNKYDKVSESYEYCPHCGARMDGDTNE